MTFPHLLVSSRGLVTGQCDRGKNLCRDFLAPLLRQAADAGFHPKSDPEKEGASPFPTFSMNPGSIKTVPFQQPDHLPVGPLLEMETLKRVTEESRYIVWTRIAMRSVKDIHTSGFEQAVNQFKVTVDIVRMKVLEKLVAERDIDRFGRQIEMVAVVDNEFEILRRRIAFRTLIGNVDSDYFSAQAGGSVAESAIAGSDLEEYHRSR